MNRKECIIFKKDNLYKTKIKTIFKLIDKEDKTNEIIFIHIESHNNTYLCLIDKDSPYNDEFMEILSHEELTTNNITEEDKIRFHHIFNSIEFCEEIYNIKKYETEEILEVYENSKYKLITNIFSYFSPNKFLMNIKDDEFKKICAKELSKSFNKILDKIYE